jgi:hypothetical protein
MNRWIKLAAIFAVAAIVAGLSGGAGATSSPAGATKASSKTAARSVASLRAARKGALLRHANLTTIAGAKRYLRAIGVNPRGVVIQRGARNYAGPNCPGASWACTSAARPVVQIAAAGGKNTFVCTSASCAVVQTRAARSGRALAAPKPPNVASCVKTTGLTQSCTISQTSAGPNSAYVYESAGKMSGLTQTASYTATITQQATGTNPTNTNTACVYQSVNIDGSTTALRGKPVTVTLRAHQAVTISQDGLAGNFASNASNSSGTSCTGDPLTQNQTLTSTAYATGPITQLENDPADPTVGPNVDLTITQNPQSCNTVKPQPSSCSAYTGGSTINFSQRIDQVALASGGQNSIPLSATVAQTEGRSNAGDQGGGGVATVNQFSKNQSTITANQVENQCELAEVSGTLPATTGPNPADGCFNAIRATGNQLPPNLTQIQFGPITSGGGPERSTARRSLQFKKGTGPSIQGDSTSDLFKVTQTSQQENDTGQDQNQRNLELGDCATTGTVSGSSGCQYTQTVKVNDAPVSQINPQGQNLNTSINCTGASCPTTPIIDTGPGGVTGGHTGSTSATFTWHDGFTGPLTFHCAIDNVSTGTSCQSGDTFTVSCAASHTFTVYATDGVGDTTVPATWNWTVPICPPTIDTGPTQPNDPSFGATFTFHDVHLTAAEPITFQCKLDAGSYSACSSGQSYPVSCGSHTFSVKAFDQFGDESAPTTYSWTVANICFDGSPLTSIPPATLGPYNMTKFQADSQPVCPADGSTVTGVTDPAGTIGFSSALSHDLATISCWATWSNGYTGDVYDDSAVNTGAAVPAQVTISLPAGTNAFYFYAEPVNFSDFTITATAQNGTTSNPVTVNGNAGAKYFGFYGTGGVTLASITVTATDTDGFAVGEFGINKSP